jgi:hypothetical protein
MPLIQCPECKAEVSDQATKCVKCGYAIRKPRRGIFGKLVKWAFILFNVLMLVWLIAGMNAAANATQPGTEAGKAGAAIGTAIGAGLIIALWVAGDIILGLFVLFTRPKT